jgi:hypothetical protein
MSSPKRKRTRSGLGYPYTLFAGAPALVMNYWTYGARTQSVRSNIVEKISCGMTDNLELSEQERVEQKAENMEHPGDRVLD